MPGPENREFIPPGPVTEEALGQLETRFILDVAALVIAVAAITAHVIRRANQPPVEGPKS